MGVVKKNTLGRFLERLGKVEKYNLDNEKIAEDVAEIGREIATEEYAGANVQIESIVSGSTAEIISRGEQIAYMEFGTGIRGEGSYGGNIPDSSTVLEFESPKGQPRKTDGWVYDYMKKLYYPEKSSFQGQPAQAQMFKTSERLQSELGAKIVEKIKGE